MVELIKFLSLWVYPLGTAVGLMLLGLLMFWLRRVRGGVWCVALGLGWLWFWSMPLVGDQAVRWLERDWVYLSAEAYPTADAIVVLGGAFGEGLERWPYPDAGSSVDRYWHAARLFRAGRAPVIVLSGAHHPDRLDRWSEAEAGALFLQDLGVPASALLLDNEARTTRENVVFIERILRDRQLDSFLLVTSALHMKRSLAAFEAMNLSPIPTPTDFSVVREPVFSIRRILPSAEALQNSTDAIHEVVGGWWYSLRE